MSDSRVDVIHEKPASKINKRWTILIPVIMFIYIIAYMDRVNIGFGLTQIREALDMSASQAGFASGIFFVGYLVLQVPGGYFAQKWSAKKVVAWLMVLWGICAVAEGLVHSYGQLLTVRFMLGVFEGGVQPALMVLINRWFPLSEKTRANSMFIMHNPIATLVTGPFAGLLLSFGDWRLLFIIQGLLPLLGVALWWVLSADKPEQAKWCSAEECELLSKKKAAEEGPVVESDWRAAVTSPFVWLLAFLGFLVWFGFYGLQMWLPTLLKQSFTSDWEVGLVSTIPPIVTAAAIYLNGRGADKDKRYNLRVAVPLIAGGIILACSTLVTADMRWVIVAVYAIATACQLSFFGSYWTINSLLVRPAAVGAGFGIINGIGNFGGFLGPYVGGWITDATGSLPLATIVFGGAVVLAGIIALALSGVVRKELAAREA
ncbi:MFS transporter [Propionimicrobium sp. PCR01-08-3]|uniref:MFS transporter n=1 Tax=Propionimicrobium sp. PCR01-08-3 TaxID=3052086 RepID=UPI00255CEED8|nr:MFS transporter [Propionimicrobium sp. PCR01-08-3]WIY83481.1 MFS transporter [Propionimicrobium sp. PCR01-08-3]